ncbi:unnamed protein product [Porites lobata]|uniref:TNF receptor-associated factor n=1 Tax=Porites lobata TaxID=104759 RepID=A0ABN8RS16_9CNID|nr:unnamed protein product [Porites lobata]
MPGYNLATSDKEGIDPKYLCNSCGLLLREAMQTACGHFYCRSCLGNLFKNGSFKMTCLQDKVELNQNEVFPDNFMRREVQAFVVNCTFKDEGCQWKGEVRNLEAHTNSCEFVRLPCVHPECGMLVKKADLPQHLETECKCRPETCGFCKKQISSNKLKLHQENECPAYPTVCEKCNKDGIPRAKLPEHQDPVVGDCDAVQGPCPFAQIGCSRTQTLNSRQKREHLESENVYHTTLLLHQGLKMGREMEAVVTRDPRILSRSPHIFTNYDGIISDILAQIQTTTVENRDLREKLRENSERITSLERKVASGNLTAAAPSAQVSGDSSGSVPNNEIARRLNNLDNKTADHEVLLVESNRSIEQANRDVGNVRRLVETVQETVRRVERRIESIEHTLALRNVTLADLEEYIRQQEFSSYDGQLLWKITEFARRRNEAVSGQQVSFYSPCFYTSRYGYKMCARIYLNGDGMGRGTHISVFFVVMRGQYDAILRWPFRQKVTFMLLDQDNVEHVIDAFRPDPNSSSFQRPRRETNIASGCPMFCSLTELNNHAYVRDDTMFLKIIVDTTDL